jgi:hypothetical protein
MPLPSSPSLTWLRQTTTTSVAQTTTTVGDPGATRTIDRIVLTLLLLAVGLLVVGWWYARMTRPVASELEGLRVVGRRSFRRASPARRDRRLAPVRRRRVDASETVVPDERLELGPLPLAVVPLPDPGDPPAVAEPVSVWPLPALMSPDGDGEERIPSEPWANRSTSTG